ncbi:aspartate carbamoyltransferase catalytic subunit [Paracoccus sp. SCSIO 75233]|uniref:aspartate carbamoyltransferase catalytic subunit n=1 Tax=Paracoccus sp. SCSIO 75233 TaxID=3017782 RepID=UPI0022F0F73E|nr:aspartate carbamoyltransferase catalytic subunit [Paracoccus sp. SCSIO 75233]WBU53868.1 aspartate carbamoyltransferase catalytic subunit [Paracoccus sp. SCSIO 75233]
MADAQHPRAGKAESYGGWQGILDDGERILWQGQPDRRVRFEPGDLSKAFPGLFFVCFSLFWMYQAAQASIAFSLFGLFFLFIGIRQLLKPAIMPAYIRSRSWYTLTDRRAIVATDIPVRGRRLVSYPIDSTTPIELVAGDPPSIRFGGSDDAAFTFIPEAEKVLALIRGIQRGELPEQEDWNP